MKSKTSPFLVALVLIAYFFVGSFWTEYRLLKGESTLPDVFGIKKTAVKTGKTTKVNIKIDNTDKVLGKNNAPLTLVVYADYQCPFCGATAGLNKDMITYMKRYDSTWEPLFPKLKQEYIDSGKVKVVYKDFVFLDDGSDGGESHLSAMAAHCAGDQNKYVEFHDYLYSNQNGENKGAFSLENLVKFANNLKLDETSFKKCLTDKKYLKKIQQSTEEGKTVGVNGTPTAFLDGVLLTDDSGQTGSFSYSVYKQRIEEALKKQKRFWFF